MRNQDMMRAEWDSRAAISYRAAVAQGDAEMEETMKGDSTEAWLGAIECLARNWWEHACPEEVRRDSESVEVLIQAWELVNEGGLSLTAADVRRRAPHLVASYEEILCEPFFDIA